MNVTKTGKARLPALAGLALLASSFGLAAPGAFLGPTAGERVDPGANLTATWSVSAPGLADTDEMELVLSLDDGATFPIRLTGRVLPGDRLVGWRVPALPTEHARIALRAGRDEEGETETILFVSEAFSIASTSPTGTEQLFAVGSEWRTREALEGAPAQPPSRSFSPGKPGPALEPLNAPEAGLEDGPAVNTSVELAASSNELPSRHSHQDTPLPSAPRKPALPLRL